MLPATADEIAVALPRWTGVDGEAARYAADFASGSMGNAIRSLDEKDRDVMMMDLFTALMDNVLDRNLLGALDAGDALAALDSREKQKAFCRFAGDCVRKIYMLQSGMKEISGVRPDEMEFFANVAGRCGETFCGKAEAALSRAHKMVERNVNQKIVFTNLVDRLFVSIK